MKQSKSINDWQSVVEQTYENFYQQLIEHIPELIGALLLLLAGWAIAWFFRFLTRKLIYGLDSLLQRAAQRRGIEKSPLRSYANLGGSIVFWCILFFFVSASAQMLGWEIFSSGLTAILGYLPNVFFGLLIILAGFAFSGFVHSAVLNAAETTGINQADVVARIAQIALILMAIIIGVEQVGIQVAFVATALIVVAGVFFGGVALAFGMGAQQFIANVLGTQATRRHYQPGQLVRIGGVQGYLLEITSTTIILDTEQGRAAVPAKLFHESVSEFIDEMAEANQGSDKNEA